MNQYNIPAIAGRICHLRKQKGLSLEEASEMLGIQRRSLSHIEAGVKGCSIDLLVRFTDIFDCSLDYLVLGRDVDGAVTKQRLEQMIDELTSLRDAF